MKRNYDYVYACRLQWILSDQAAALIFRESIILSGGIFVQSVHARVPRIVE